MDQWLQTVPAWIYDLPSGLRTLLYQLYQTFVAADRWDKKGGYCRHREAS